MNIEGKVAISSAAVDVGDVIVSAMARGGIDHLFFTSGSEIAFYQEAIAKSKQTGTDTAIRLITVPHEHTCLNAALGFAAVTGRPAATAAHIDCGTLNYGGALHTAWRSGLPVVITAGYPPTAAPGTMKGARDVGVLWMQEPYDQHGIVRNYTKWDRRLTYQDHPGVVVSRAIQAACAEPCGPVYFSVPKELAFLPVAAPEFPSAGELGIPRPAAPDVAAIDELARRLVAAARPVVVVSGSGRDVRTVPKLVELCELLGLAVTSAAQPQYLCFPLRHPLYQGEEVLSDADFVLVLDADVPWVHGQDSPPRGAYVAAIGHDPAKLRLPINDFVANMRLTASALSTIEALLTAVKPLLTDKMRQGIARRAAKLHADSHERIAIVESEALGKAGRAPIDKAWLGYQLGQALDDNCVVFDDTLGHNRVSDYLACSRPGSYFANPGSSGGWSPGAAFGAKLGAPDRDMIAVTGDGFYMFGTPATALWAAGHHGAPFMVVVYTNRSYSTGTTSLRKGYGAGGYAERGGFEGGYFDPPIDFAMEAEAAGAYGETVRDPADLGHALRRGLSQIRSGRCAVISVWMERLEAGN